MRDRYAGNLKVAMPLGRYRGWEQDRSLRVMVRGDALMAEEVEKVVLEPAFCAGGGGGEIRDIGGRGSWG